MTIRQLIKADGTRRELVGPHAIRDVAAMIGAETLDTVNLRHLGFPMQVMLVDDAGHKKKLPVNAEATALYRANCGKGAQHVIRGDVVVLPDDDFAPVPTRAVPLDPNGFWPFPERARAVDGAGGEPCRIRCRLAAQRC